MARAQLFSNDTLQQAIAMARTSRIACLVTDTREPFISSALVSMLRRAHIDGFRLRVEANLAACDLSSVEVQHRTMLGHDT